MYERGWLRGERLWRSYEFVQFRQILYANRNGGRDMRHARYLRE